MGRVHVEDLGPDSRERQLSGTGDHEASEQEPQQTHLNARQLLYPSRRLMLGPSDQNPQAQQNLMLARRTGRSKLCAARVESVGFGGFFLVRGLGHFLQRMSQVEIGLADAWESILADRGETIKLGVAIGLAVLNMVTAFLKLLVP